MVLEEHRSHKLRCLVVGYILIYHQFMERIGNINAVIIDFGNDIFTYRYHLIFGLIEYSLAVANEHLYEVQYIALLVAERLCYGLWCRVCWLWVWCRFWR